MSKASEFLKRYGMDAQRVNVLECSRKMRDDMKRGLAGEVSDMPMIPTYLTNDGVLPLGRKAVVIDAGGTNFRSAGLTFTENGAELSGMSKCKMPGIGKSAAWEEFISFIADHVQPLLEDTDSIGFCFSYSANITPEVDGRVIRIDKEVVITGSEEQLVGASLLAELARRGVTGKKIAILNDTAAVLLGGTASMDKSEYDGFIGQVSGTGTNTCAVVALKDIPKLPGDTGSMIINLESGLFTDIPRGEFDLALDAESQNPGLKFFEKLTAGVYLGELARLMLLKAGEEGLIGERTLENVRALGKFDSSVIDAWAVGEGLETAENAEDAAFLTEISRNLFERSARSMCANLVALMELNDAGKEKPCCICAEGSLVQKGRVYKPMLDAFLAENTAKLHRSYRLHVGEETTLPGAAAAVLLNK